jgi:hypothetical protein
MPTASFVLLEEFGPAYFHSSRLTSISAETYRQFAPALGGRSPRAWRHHPLEPSRDFAPYCGQKRRSRICRMEGQKTGLSVITPSSVEARDFCSREFIWYCPKWLKWATSPFPRSAGAGHTARLSEVEGAAPPGTKKAVFRVGVSEKAMPARQTPHLCLAKSFSTSSGDTIL